MLEWFHLAETTIKKILKDFGLTDTESEVYLFLSKHGPDKGTQVAKKMHKDKAQIYHALKKLLSKGIVESTIEAPVRFTAVPFENVVESTISEKRSEAKRIESTKKELLRYWNNIDKNKSESLPERFTVIEGRHRVYSKIKQMIQETKNQLMIITTIPNLIRAENYGLYSVASKNILKSQIQFRFLTDLRDQDKKATQKILNKMVKQGFNFKGKSPEIGHSLFPQMVLRDGEEAIFFINPVEQDVIAGIRDDVCFWTNCRSLVQAFSLVFEDYWRSSKDLQKKLDETQIVIHDKQTIVKLSANEAQKKYSDTLKAAQTEIVMVTSSEGLLELSDLLASSLQNERILKRIMAPITNENLSTANEMMKHCEIRHVPRFSMGTTIVDGRNLFQIKYLTIKDTAYSSGKVCFENVFFSNNKDNIKKAKTLLDDLWNNSKSPSPVTLEALNQTSTLPVPEAEDRLVSMNRKIKGASVIESGFPSQVTEKEILDKVINQKTLAPYNTNEIARTFGSNAQAIVHFPQEFNLPSMLLHLLHIDKRSTFGAEDVVAIHFWLNTPVGEAYVPVALITDNPNSVDFWKRFLAGSPASQNIQLLEKDRLEINVHSNILFAGWTVPISIPPHTIPPSGVLIEGSGKIKPSTFSIQAPSGFVMKTEYNGCDAFVTFLHPSSKYSGPGTEGLLGRDAIMEFYSPRSKESVASK